MRCKDSAVSEGLWGLGGKQAVAGYGLAHQRCLAALQRVCDRKGRQYRIGSGFETLRHSFQKIGIDEGSDCVMDHHMRDVICAKRFEPCKNRLLASCTAGDNDHPFRRRQTSRDRLIEGNIIAVNDDGDLCGFLPAEERPQRVLDYGFAANRPILFRTLFR